MSTPPDRAPAATGVIRLLVADDHPVTREGLALILDHQPDMAVVAQAGDGEAAVAQYHAHRPDVAVLDLQMPRLTGAEATAAICAGAPGARVLLLTTYDGDEDIYRAMRAGALGYLLKDAPREEILRAVRAAHAGRRVLSPGVGAKLADRLAQPALTPREREVLALVARGKANKEIAFALGVSEGTVKSHLNAVTAKLGVSSRTEAALAAERRGLLR